MRNKVIHLTVLLSCCLCFSQQQITWNDLSKVKFTDKYFSEYDSTFLYPEFLPSVKALEGKQITVKGYFLDIGAEEEVYVLSKGPMSSCFFCGVGGPETAIELQFENTPIFITDDIVSITGTLKLNQDDVEHFNYILTGCQGKLIE